MSQLTIIHRALKAWHWSVTTPLGTRKGTAKTRREANTLARLAREAMHDG